MKLPWKERALSTVVVLGLGAVLMVLAVLQYRWSGEVSEAASARMKAGLEASMMGFRQDLYRELAALCTSFQNSPEAARHERLAAYARQYDTWRRTSNHAGLLANVYVFSEAGRERGRLLRLNAKTNQFEPAGSPEKFAPLLERLSAASGEIVLRLRPPNDALGRPGLPRRPRHAGAPWSVEENIPALVHPVFDDAPRQAMTVDWIILELDSRMLAEHLFPELAERYFAGRDGLEYRFVVNRGDTAQPAYSSEASARVRAEAPDGVLNLFGPPHPPISGAPGMAAPRGPGAFFAGPRGEPGGPPGPHPAFAGPLWIAPIHYGPQDTDWQLTVWHRNGSLDAVVAGMRRRNLAMSFGVLLVLAATMAMILIVSHRARRLAALKMDFVAGVSHELRTPLAVISSAADNIADGVVTGPAQVKHYGVVIKKQALQLKELVEQVLLFASTRQDRAHYVLRPVEVRDVVDAALGSTAELVRSSGFSVEPSIEPNLPPILADLSAVSHCLQNLITNAVKYGGNDRWIGIRACASNCDGSGKYVSIMVSDHGDGIAPPELTHIFEAFYRSPAAAAAQIHGTGLGLSLAKRLAEALGGRLTVASEQGRGTEFTLQLRCAEMPDGEETQRVEQSEASAITQPPNHTMTQ